MQVILQGSCPAQLLCVCWVCFKTSYKSGDVITTYIISSVSLFLTPELHANLWPHWPAPLSFSSSISVNILACMFLLLFLPPFHFYLSFTHKQEGALHMSLLQVPFPLFELVILFPQSIIPTVLHHARHSSSFFNAHTAPCHRPNIPSYRIAATSARSGSPYHSGSCSDGSHE